MDMKKTIVTLIVIAIVIIGIYFINKNLSQPAEVKQPATEDTEPQATSTQNGQTNKEQTVIGKSIEGRDILAYHYGTGTKELLFVGGIHGGYEWNTALVAYELIGYLKANPA